MNKNLALFVSGIVFGLVAIGHLLRVIYQIQLVAAGHILPMNISYIGFVIALVLSIWMFVASKK